MKHTIRFARLDGGAVMLHGYLAIDGTIEFLEVVDPETGRHVSLSSLEKWLAVTAMSVSVNARLRGAA